MPEYANILPQHERLLRASVVTPDIASARGYRSVTKKAELKSLGFSERQCRVPSLLIPIRNAFGEIVSYQSRPDDPRVGDRGKVIKYETPAKTTMALDVPSYCRVHLGDPTFPLFITEGVRKADSAAGIALCCIDILGVWNWRGTNGLGGKTALSDWELIALNDRQIYICFDSDVIQKPQVHSAMVRLKGFLESRGAVVSIIYLPSGPQGQKVGLDDYIAAGHHVQDLLSLSQPDVRVHGADASREAKHPYLMQDDGIYRILARRNEEKMLQQLTNFTARITAEVVVDDGSKTHRALEIETDVCGVSSRTLFQHQRIGFLPAEQEGHCSCHRCRWSKITAHRVVTLQSDTARP